MKTPSEKGDEKETSLLFGKRVLKSDLRCEAYGTIDEAVSSLGFARNLVRKDKSREIITKVQKELFAVSAELATQPEDYDKFAATFQPVTDEMVSSLERITGEIEAEIQMPQGFVIPGTNLASAALDVSRTIVRRAERRAVVLEEQNEIRNEAILRYLNQLSDLLFAVARYEET